MIRANPTILSFFLLPALALITPIQWPVIILDRLPLKRGLRAINQIERRMMMNVILSIEVPILFVGRDLNSWVQSKR